jgi:hypothetical protein
LGARLDRDVASYDRALRDKRLESYQKLFHISKCFPRYGRPTARDSSEKPDVPPLSAAESQALLGLASELRQQLSADVGATNPPKLQWTRPGRAFPLPPPISG